MCLVLAPILGSYQVRQGRSGLVPGHDTFFYDFFHCADTQLVQRHVDRQKEPQLRLFFMYKQGVTKRGTAA